MTFRSTLCLLLLFCLRAGFSQSSQAEYLEAKRLLQNENFQDAGQAFSALTQDRIFGKYSSFYRGYCSYRNGDKKEAIVLWEQLLGNAPGELKREVLFWLAYSCLESGLYSKGILYANSLTTETKSATEEKGLLNTFLKPLSSEQLKSLYVDTQNPAIASLILSKESSKPFGERDTRLIREILESGILEAESILNEDLPTVKKPSYNVAVLLPFMYDGAKPEWILQNQLVTSLYQGMQLGRDYLDSIGIRLELLPYDTKRDEFITEIHCRKLPKETDVIVGPLYPGPIKVVGEYALKNKVNMINPVSSNSDVILNNPFSFLFKPTNETIANELATYADTTFTNRNVMIFYEQNQRDSITAFTYKKQVELRGFNVVWFQEINKSNAKQILDTITAQYTVYYTKAEADSILLLPGRFVKERRLRQDELSRLKAISEGKRPRDSLFYLPVTLRESDQREVTYYESKFYIGEDSIGHIFGASRNNALVNNLISAVETKGNNIGLLGYGDWIDFTMLSYNQLERIGVVMANPDFYDPNSLNYQEFASKVKKLYFCEPSLYHMIGYDLIIQIGRQLSEHGTYFQNGLRQGDFYKGVLFEGIQYGIFNDNQVVPLVRFENDQLKVVNQGK